jgi:hypothetical protein
MTASIFDLKNIVPNDAMLAHELGEALDWFRQICTNIENNIGSLTIQWKYYGQQSGWVMKLIHHKRNLLFVVPLRGSFRVVFTFGDKAFNMILSSDVSEAVKRELLQVPRHTEGRTIQLAVHDEDQLDTVFKLLKIKHNN